MTITFTGLSSVSDRILFTNRGPIVKSPVPILSGLNLTISSPDEVVIPTGSFTQSTVGKTITISGSPGGRNDGTFYISEVKGPSRLKLSEASFDVSNYSIIESQIVALANDLKSKYNAHRTRSGIHGTNDPSNIVSSPTAVDLASASLILNELLSSLKAHSITVGPLDPPVHSFADPESDIWSLPSDDLHSAVLLANELRARYESHRQNRFFHLESDFQDRITVPSVIKTVGSGPMIGPFTWVISDPRDGQIADDPSDVSVLVAGLPASVDAVFGLLGAVVLSTKPGPTDSVLIDYRYMSNPPTQFERLNSPEFVLNQVGNRGYSGLPGHKYRQRSYLVNPSDMGRLVKSPFSPMRVGWKYKGYERKYTACLNDPNSLLLNVPANRIMYPVLFESVFDTVVRYDPSTLPQNATDAWVYEGSGSLSLIPSSGGLIIKDDGVSFDSNPGPPFFSHPLDLTFDSEVYSAYRFSINDSDGTLNLEGCFTGVGFGLTDGQKATVVGCVYTDANNLSSAVSMANDLNSKYSSHLVLTGTHIPNDNANVVKVVDAFDTDSLIVLINKIKSLYNSHISIGPSNVHLIADSVNQILTPDAYNLDSAITLTNSIRSAFNAHLTQSGVHYHDDGDDSVGLVKQVGILSTGFVEEESSWNSFAHDWAIETTYRIHRDAAGNIGLFLSGDVEPRVYSPVASLPEASSVDLRFDPVFQTFFGSIGDASTSVSTWKFARINVNPVDSVQIGQNKSVIYYPTVTPELDPEHPWIVVGQGGTERVSRYLIVDSTSSVSDAESFATGKITGEYRGYLRIEPSITDRTTVSFEFTLDSSFFSFGVDNRSLGVHIGDGDFATQICFLQSAPVPASVTGTLHEPFPVVSGDIAIFSIDGGRQITATAIAPISTASGVVTLLNSAAGISFAASSGPFPSYVNISSPTRGSSSTIKIFGGQIFEKLGIPTGTYRGSDTAPEPKVSWSGIDLPEKGFPTWSPAGSQSATMLERTLRISDSSTTDFKSYTISDPIVVSPALSNSSDWKSDFRVRVISYVPGDRILSGPGLRPCGALMNVDEGPSGKGVDLHLSVDPGGSPYIGVYSYNSISDALDYVSGWPFVWNDGLAHSFSVYTSKFSNLVLMFADGVFLGSFAFSLLNAGIFGPSITFGSGTLPVTNGDPSTSTSVVDWESVCLIKDTKVLDAFAASNKFVGVYRGGDPSVLSSYYLAQVDWSSPHTYRVVRDPVQGVSVFLDGAQAPIISAGYDVLTLPIESLNFLSGVVPSGKFIAFGSFNPSEICRSTWDTIKYSIGKMTVSDGLIPPRHRLNMVNVVASPEHLRTTKPHSHYGFSSYSGGTPSDDFMADPEVPAFTTLGEGTPPVPMTQDLQSRGGLVTTVTPVESIASVDLINRRGQLASFENDLENTVTLPSVSGPTSTETTIISDVTTFISKYHAHIASGVYHVIPDAVNGGIPTPVTFANALASLNLMRTKYASHLSQAGVHYNNDTSHMISAPVATDIATAVTLLQDLTDKFNWHISSNVPHLSAGLPFDPLPDYISLANYLKDKFNSHRVELGVHTIDDMADVVSSPYATDLLSAVTLANEIRFRYESHRVYPGSHPINDTFNPISAPLANDQASLISLLSDIETKYNLHRVQAGVHVLNDTVNPTADGNEKLVRIIEEIREILNSHVMDLSAHPTTDQSNQVITPLLFNLSGASTVADQNVYISVLNQLLTSVGNHFSRNHHLTDDYVNLSAVSAITLPFNFASAVAAAVSLRSALSSHIVNSIQAHSPADNTHSFVGSTAVDPLPASITLANLLLDKMKLHFARKLSHLKIDSVADLTPAFDLVSLIPLLNGMKLSYNAHLTKAGVHVTNDVVNPVLSPDASDLDTSVVLLNDILSMYELHRVSQGVHSNVVVLRLDPPSGVLYESMKFYAFPSGEVGHISSVSDDETLYFSGGIKQQQVHRLSYTGGSLPDHATMLGSAVEPFPIIDDDNLSISINGNAPIEVIFQTGDTSVANVISRINGTTGIPIGFASDNGDGRVRLIEPVGGAGSWIDISGSSAQKLGLDTSQPTPWLLAADDSSSVSATLMSAGPVDFMRMGTTGLGTKAAYVAKTSLVDSSSAEFSATFRARIHSWSYNADGDTGIYLGVSGAAGPGFTAAIGFVIEAGVRTVILRDLTSWQRIAARAFDWGDGGFHTYKITKNFVGRISLEVSP